MRTLLFVPAVDTRAAKGQIESRIGLAAEAISLDSGANLLDLVGKEHAAAPVACVLIDEAQFLTTEQARQATDIADKLRIPVLCYGLSHRLPGTPFPGKRRTAPRSPTT